MSYKITITKIEEVKATKEREYRVIDHRPWTQKELDDNVSYEPVEKFLERTPLKQVMGYAPEVETTKPVETEVLKQTVDELDLAAVIKAINRL